jgi:glutamate N-acetyltransferase/amino-acid N-acetyltransferase
VAIIDHGHVTSPQGFLAGAAYAGIKTLGADPLDVGILVSQHPASCAAMFTKSSVKGAAVLHSMMAARSGRARGVVVNAGISNVGTGREGQMHAAEMTRLAADRINALTPLPADWTDSGGNDHVVSSELLVGSTGVIGRPLPIGKIRAGIGRIELSATGGLPFARAIMTTDTHPKTMAVRVTAGRREYRIGAVAKGSGMIHPDMATMFCFLTTDAPVAQPFLRIALRDAVADSLNMLSVDADTSTSDTTAIFSNGAGGGPPIAHGSDAAATFQSALRYVCIEMARMLARDGEGAEKLIEVRIDGALSDREARAAARTVTASPLVKTAVHGNDPNWGRLLMAVGRSYVRINLDRARAWINDVQVYDQGPVDFDARAASKQLAREHVVLRVDLGAGRASATAWGCDMTPEYVHINADYTT